MARNAWRRARVSLWRFKRSPEQQDRATAAATFAFIGLFAITSVDAIVTGGADFVRGDDAYAMEFQAPAANARPQPALVPEAVDAPSADEPLVEEIDYSFTSEVLLGGPQTMLAEHEAVLNFGGMIAKPRQQPQLEPVVMFVPATDSTL